MALDFLNPEALATLGQAIRKKRESIGWTQEKLAGQSGYSDKVIRNIEHGARTRLQTIKNICQALGLPEDLYGISGNAISGAKYGAYNLSHYADYVGIYFGFRRGLSIQSNFLRTVYEIAWSPAKGCLEFFEDHKYTSSTGRKIDFSQNGEIYINNDIGLLHLLTCDHGAMRLITLAKLRRDDNHIILEGVVLTQLRSAHHFSPAVSPIYLKKTEDVQTRSEVASLIGPISPADELYAEVATYIEEVEREVAYFPPTSSIDPKVTRISSRAAKRRD
ncbi:MAG: helix-turn-helix domain-containing protein [Alphaproteobacteria bacterium]|nr:helix-turn-helix domain-containing protein [Alphaproteobacteria bacterium]